MAESLEYTELEARYQRYREILKNLTLMSDIFMRNVLKQKDYKNLQGRSAILDCVVRDGDGKQFDVEIQQENEGASPKRARYHAGLMDMNTLNPGGGFR